MNRVKPIIWGVAIVALGVIFGGNALGLFELNVFFHGWWTLFIIVPSMIGIFTEKEKLASLFMLAVGVILLLAAQDVFSYGVAWKVIFAILLVIFGVKIIFQGIFGNTDKEVEKKIKNLGGEKMDSQIAVFSGSERTYNNETFVGSNLVAVFGGVDLDLTNAKISKDAVIKAFCLFGGIDIKVPKDVQVKIRSRFVFGGASDERHDKAEKGARVIYIDAAGGFGGVSVDDRPDFDD